MQGTLNEIDIRSILQLIELGQRTGVLLVEAYHYLPAGKTSQLRKYQKQQKVCFVFFVNGQITYAADETNTNLSRLVDYLYYYNNQIIIDSNHYQSIAQTNVPEYAYIWHLLENGVLSPAQGRGIISNMVDEILFDLLSINQGYFIFEKDSALEPQLITLEIGSKVTKIMKQVQQWKEFHPHIDFPYQAPIIVDDHKLRETLPKNAYQNLYRWADGKTTLRQISRYLNRDILTIARAIYPYVEKGLLQLVGSTKPLENWDLTDKKLSPHIVCIDDDLTIGKSVEYILKANNYDVTIITEPLNALSLVFQIKPDLILCDISMPHLDGYEICAMLRRSTAFRQIPIIMLTGKETFIDRIQARMAGATDYLTKPFGENELLLLLEKWI